MLRQTESVTWVVHHYGGSAPVLHAWRAFKCYTARLQFIVRFVDVIRIKDTAAKHALVYQGPQLRCRFLIQHHSRFGLHQNDFKAGLVFDSHCEPPIVFANLGVRIDLESQFVPIELERLLLVLHPYQHVRHFRDHSFSLSFRFGKEDKRVCRKAASRKLLNVYLSSLSHWERVGVRAWYRGPQATSLIPGPSPKGRR